MMTPNVISVAGSDPSGGAGIQADLKTFSALGCYGMAAMTSLTVQNTQGVRDVLHLDEGFFIAQLEAIFDDIDVDAMKIGMVGNARAIKALARFLEKHGPRIVVLDPVMVATSGDSLISGHAVKVLRDRLLPLCHILTPNIPEGEKLLGRPIAGMEEDAQALARLGCKNVFLKGGHRRDAPKATDVFYDGSEAHVLSDDWVDTKNTHGTGCTLSSALAALRARGLSRVTSAKLAKAYLTKALQSSYCLRVGKGHGPVNHLCDFSEELAAVAGEEKCDE